MFSPETSLQEIAIQDHSLAFFLRRYVSDGDWTKALKDLCDEHKLEINFLNEILTGLSRPEAIPFEVFECYSTRELLRFLNDGHRHYLKTVLPELQQLVYQLQLSERPQLSGIWNSFIISYGDHLKAHFKEEEHILFPLANNLERAGKYLLFTEVQKASAYIAHFESEHMEEVNELEALRKSLLKYKSRNASLKAIDRLILVMSSFEKDIFIHDLIEEKVLLPRMKNSLRERLARFN